MKDERACELSPLSRLTIGFLHRWQYLKEWMAVMASCPGVRMSSLALLTAIDNCLYHSLCHPGLQCKSMNMAHRWLTKVMALVHGCGKKDCLDGDAGDWEATMPSSRRTRSGHQFYEMFSWRLFTNDSNQPLIDQYQSLALSYIKSPSVAVIVAAIHFFPLITRHSRFKYNEMVSLWSFHDSSMIATNH